MLIADRRSSHRHRHRRASRARSRRGPDSRPEDNGNRDADVIWNPSSSQSMIHGRALKGHTGGVTLLEGSPYCRAARNVAVHSPWPHAPLCHHDHLSRSLARTPLRSAHDPQTTRLPRLEPRSNEQRIGPCRASAGVPGHSGVHVADVAGTIISDQSLQSGSSCRPRRPVIGSLGAFLAARAHHVIFYQREVNGALASLAGCRRRAFTFPSLPPPSDRLGWRLAD